MLSLRTLGVPRLDHNEHELLRGRRKELALLAYLARRGEGVSREALADLLWGHRPDGNARQSLRQALVQLKRAVPEGLDAEGDIVALAPGALTVDVREFETDLAAGRVEAAVARWRGEFLAGCEDVGGPAFDAWVEGERVALRARLRGAFAALLAESDRRADHPAALRWATRWADAFPLDEEAAARVVRDLHRAGRVPDALARHASFVERLRQDLDAVPSPDFARLAAEVQPAASAGSPAPASGALFTPELVGRRRALAALDGAWSSAVAGATMLVLVEGEDGIGKTRLIEEFARRIPGRFVLLHARGSEAARKDRWGVLHELVVTLADAPGLAGARPSTLATLASFVPAIRERLAAGGDASPAAPADALADALMAVAAELPILLLIDDVPLVDRESRDAVLTVVRRVRQAAMCCVLTSRSGDTPSELIAELRGRAGETRIRLGALSEDEVESLLASMIELAPELRASVAKQMHTESGGNPFYLSEALAALVDEGRFAADERGLWRPIAGEAERHNPMPASLRAAVRRRLDTLSPAARRVAAAVAVLMPVATRSWLAHVTQLPTAELDAALEELELRRIVRVPDAETGAYAFAHEVTRRAMLDAVAGRERRRLQRRARHAPGARAGRPSGPQVPAGGGLRGVVVGGAVVLGLGAAAAFWAVARGGRADIPAVYAVGRIQDFSGERVATAVADMMTTSLARLPGLSVVSSARMYELTAGDTARVLAAARRAGATVLLNGALFKGAAGDYRLELQGTAVEDGRVLRANRIEGDDLFAVVDSATAAVARARGDTGPVPALASQTTRSVAAYRLYSEGLRAYYLHNLEAARALLDAAVVEDSNFALAWRWGARAYLNTSYRDWRRRMDHAVALAPHAPERERLLILSDYAITHDAPERLALAETLATRFPGDAEAQLQLGVALKWDGQFLAATEAYGRALALDSGGLAAARPGERCLACEAVAGMSSAYLMADSLETSIEVIRPWTRVAPGSAEAWSILADGLMYAGPPAEAYAAGARVAALSTPEGAALEHALITLHAAEDWDEGARFFENEVNRPEQSFRAHGLWWMIIIRRNQGRLNEALALSRRYLALGGNRLPEAQIRFEGGEFAAAARLFRALASAPSREEPPSRQARDIAWNLTHTATALAAAGDTAPLGALADSVAVLGQLTAYGRDRRLHHHIRGLLLKARGRTAEAAAQFEQAVFSRTAGYTRTNYELGRALLAERRPAEAVRLLRSALHGSLESSNYYMTRTELHALLGAAFEAAGQPDSAVTHYRRVLDFWRGADPAFHERRAEVARRVDALTRR